MSTNVIIVTLSRYPDLFSRLSSLVGIWELEAEKLLVRDGTTIQQTHGWEVIQGKQPFIYARNVNAAWDWAGDDDVILIGDDVEVRESFVIPLQNEAYSRPDIGIACAQLHGQSPFVMGYFKREVIDAVGPMDEQFIGYGYEDNDWCKRMEALGWQTQPITLDVTHNGGTSFWRREKEGQFKMQQACDESRERFNRKWRS